MKMKSDPEHPECSCEMSGTWPPAHAIAYGPDPEMIRNSVDNPTYERMRVWRVNCGLIQIDGSPTGKCQECTHFLVNGVHKIKSAPKLKAAPASRARDLRTFRDN